jgi:hypothetical protein
LFFRHGDTAKPAGGGREIYMHNESSMSKAGLDNRHRSNFGEISHNHGNTLIGTLRKVTDRVSRQVILKPQSSARFYFN